MSLFHGVDKIVGWMYTICTYLSPIYAVWLIIYTVCPNIYTVCPPIYRSRIFCWKGDEIDFNFNFQISCIWQNKKITHFCHYYSRVGSSWVVRQLVTINTVTIKGGVGRSLSKLVHVHYIFCFLRLPLIDLWKIKVIAKIKLYCLISDAYVEQLIDNYIRWSFLY